MANRLSTEKRAAVVRALVEGNSIRATVRMTGVAKNTVTKLLVDLGTACSEYLDGAVTGLNTERVQCDEIWSYCYAKNKNVPEEYKGTPGYGDVWTWVALDADTKLAITWLVGERTYEDAMTFALDLATRVKPGVQVTTDALGHYRQAIPEAFRGRVDFAQQRKIWARGYDSTNAPAHVRYSPSRVHAVETTVRNGDPDPEHISTSYVERQNLTMRMGMRRFTRLTNAFSKKVENLSAAVSLHFAYYNLCRVHQTLKTTPAVAAGVEDHVWTVEELCELLQAVDKRGSN